MLRNRIWDPVLFWPPESGSGMGKIQIWDPGSGINILDHISGSYSPWNRDPGWENSRSGIRDQE
jgi:hypothetical protein